MARIKWNIKGFQQLRRSPGIKARLKKEADQVRDASGSGYVTQTGEGKTRSRAAVITGDHESARDNSDNNTLLKNLKGA